MVGMQTTFPTRRTRGHSQRSKLDWDEAGAGEHARLQRLYRDLIALRRTDADMADPWLYAPGSVDYDEDAPLDRRCTAAACGSHAISGTTRLRYRCSGEVVLAWGEPTVDADSTVLERHSFAILRDA